MKRKQPICMFILGFIGLAEDLAMILSLGFLTPEFRSWLFFKCDWYERLGEWEEWG